ncbi:hypothetical protein DL769_006558 [Monosporascus sp. CRB-8-3]|nr:hypothetical protein DL769_006558 [Monosporascus sp. CRB-8-3]
MSRHTPTRSRLPQQRVTRIGPEPSNIPRMESRRHKPGSNASALPQVQRRLAPKATNTALEQHPQAVTYIYTQLFCGLCGRYMTDIGGPSVRSPRGGHPEWEATRPRRRYAATPSRVLHASGRGAQTRRRDGKRAARAKRRRALHGPLGLEGRSPAAAAVSAVAAYPVRRRPERGRSWTVLPHRGGHPGLGCTPENSTNHEGTSFGGKLPVRLAISGENATGGF